VTDTAAEQAPTDPRLGAGWRFARAMVGARGAAGDGAVDAVLAAGFTRAHVLQLVTVIATKTIPNDSNPRTHSPKEGFMTDPALAWFAPRAVAAGHAGRFGPAHPLPGACRRCMAP
jgi:hypothetical protein